MNSRLLKYISMFIIFSLLITVGIYSYIMHTPVLKPVCRKKSVSMSFLMKNNFLEKFSSNVKFTVALHAQKSVTGVDTNNLMFCLFSDKSSFLMFSSFPSAVLLLHNRTQSICTMPVTFFYEWGVLEWTRLAGHMIRFKIAWQRIFAWSFLFQIFLHLFKKNKR